MILRYARHTNNLKRIENFYTKIIGLEKLGSFENHNAYDGTFLGLPEMSWHLEFTSSNEQANSKFDEDDALVFYLESENKVMNIKQRLSDNEINTEIPRNPYWKKNGLMISDPDGYKIIFSIMK